jgi:hypothetical protein
MEKQLNYKLCYNNTKLKWSNPDFSGLIDEQIERTQYKKPSVILIDGVHSGGKTTLGAHIGQYIESKYGQDFDYENQVGKGMDKFLERVKWCRQNNKHVCIYDEAEDYDRKGAMTKLNRLLNKIFSIIRINKINIIMILGCVKILEKQPLTKGLIRGLINVHNREIKKPFADLRVYDASNVFYLMWLMDKHEKTGKSPLSAYSKTYAFMKSHILKADPEDEVLWDSLDRTDKFEMQDEAILETKGLINIDRVSKESGYSVSYLRILFRKIKPEAQRIGNKNYYYRSILKRIENTANPKK